MRTFRLHCRLLYLLRWSSSHCHDRPLCHCHPQMRLCELLPNVKYSISFILRYTVSSSMLQISVELYYQCIKCSFHAKSNTLSKIFFFHVSLDLSFFSLLNWILQLDLCSHRRRQRYCSRVFVGIFRTDFIFFLETG